MIDFKALAAPFPAEAISWRVGSTNKEKTKGMALAFIDARDVMDRLDAICTPAGWACSYSHANGKTVCDIAIKCGDEWVSKADGAGDSEVEAEKGALSDAFKRAAVRWGVGRYLYDLASPWVAIEPLGRSYKIAEVAKPGLRALLNRNGAPQERAQQQAAQEASEPEGPTAEELAINHLRSCAIDGGMFKEAWQKNKGNWKDVLSDDAYARVVAEMQLLAAKFAPAKQTEAA